MLKQKYLEFREELRKELDLKNVMEVPKLEKIVVNIGKGEAAQNIKLLDTSRRELACITGQKAAVRRAKKSIAGFKIREKMPIGCAVTLRRAQMYEFLYRLINIAVPRIRDFRGYSIKSFDGRGNYSLGITEQIIFPEIDYDKVDKISGLSVTIVTTAKDDVAARSLLKRFNFPFKRTSA
ncbi:MAG: 50S ribosomal protein L5 [Pseudomonadota bacterium]|nr:50S ribosomal protein L5 [Pseudomonadota bacterium]